MTRQNGGTSMANHDLGEALSYHDRLPLGWVPLQSLPEGLEAERLAESNARLLVALTLLSEHPVHNDEPSAAELEMQRVQQKLNLLLELVGGFLGQQAARPPAVPLRLSWRGVVWQGGGLQMGAAGMVELYLSPMLPQPLRWPARIAATGAGAAEGETHAEFAPAPDFCQAALERHVFQQHRRQIAETRQPARQQIP
jgi:hypothetical protein